MDHAPSRSLDLDDLLVAGGDGPGHSPSTRARPLQLIVGFDPGGGFDTYARRALAPSRPDIPGNPSIVVVENMTGAGA